MVANSPMTQTQDTTLLKTFSVAQLIQAWQDTFHIDIHDEISGCDEICLYECNQTKLQFFTPSGVVGSNKLYEKLQQFDWYYMLNKWEHQTALKHLSGCRTVLEIGSGSGHFVKSAIAAGLDAKGIELNEAAVTTAKQHGLPVEHCDLEKAADRYQGRLDGVCSFQVLEHVPNPKEFIQYSMEMLKPGGILIYCVPNAESYLRFQHCLLDMPPHHMLRWSKTSFKSLESLFPIRLNKVICEPLADYHVLDYLNTYRAFFRQKSAIARLVFNHQTLRAYTSLLKLGLRRFLPGQSLYVQFRKS